MAQKKSPAAARRQGFENGKALQAISDFEASALTLELQRHSPVAWLAKRANVALSTARVHAELFGIGGAHA